MAKARHSTGTSEHRNTPRGFDGIFAEWNTNRKQQSREMTDDEAERLNEQESTLLNRIIATPAASAGEIAAKVFVAKELIEQSGSRWSDARDVKVLDSIMEDLTRFGAKPSGCNTGASCATNPRASALTGRGFFCPTACTHTTIHLPHVQQYRNVQPPQRASLHTDAVDSECVPHIRCIGRQKGGTDNDESIQVPNAR